MATTITANGINFPDGSAGTPSIGGSDTNTGLFTGSDIVGFATGGSERLKIDASGNVNIANDSGKLRLGASNDLQIFHNGTNNYIDSLGSAIFYNRPNADWYVSDYTSNENRIKAIKDGAVELYHNGSKKLETMSTGAYVEGYLAFPDSGGLRIGSGNDLQIHHDGTKNLIETHNGEIHINKGTSEFLAKFIPDGAVELYFDNTKRLYTRSTGAGIAGTLYLTGDILATADNQKLLMGASNDLQIYHDGTHSYLDNSTGSFFVRGDTIKLRGKSADEDMIEAFVNGAVRLYYDNSKKFETNSAGVKVTGQIEADEVYLRDSEKILLGTGSDLEIYHDGSDSFIKDTGVGGIRVDTNQFVVRSANGNTNRMAINDDDTVVVGGTSSEAFKAITLSPDHDDGAGRITFNRANTSNVSIVVSMKNASSEAGRIEHDNTSCGIFSSSDYRLKENVVPISDGITRVKTLKPYRFNFKTNANKTVDGFFAHEVTAVPESVSGTKDQVDSDNNPVYQAIDQSKLVPLLVAALQEAIGRIEALEAA